MIIVFMKIYQTKIQQLIFSQCKYYDINELKQESYLATNTVCIYVNALSVAANFFYLAEMF